VEAMLAAAALEENTVQHVMSSIALYLPSTGSGGTKPAPH